MSADSASGPLRGRWFDGRTTQARPVLVGLERSPDGPRLQLHPLTPGAQGLTLAYREVGWPPAWSAGRVPPKVVVDLRNHGSLEIDDALGWRAALAAAGERPALVQGMQTRWTVFLAVLLVAAGALWAFYRWGTPWAATQITRHVPLGWETALAGQALTDLDGALLKPSRLPVERQAQLRERFGQLTARLEPALQRYPGYAPPLSLSFRSGFGANAFALPGGTIVMTDGLVEAAARHQLPDEALVGVLAHEVGHVVHRHTTRMVVEQGVLNIGLGLALGDVSSLLSTGASLLTGLAYRRGHESEADCFSLSLMKRAQLPTAPMADLLMAIDTSEKKKKSAQAEETEGGALAELLSSHPLTPERARRLRLGHDPACRA